MLLKEQEKTQILSETLFNEASKYIPGGVNSPVRAFRSVGCNPFYTKSANGAFLSTVDGKNIVDMIGSWGPAILGHNHTKIKAAILEALESGTSFGTSCAYEIDMARKIVELVPSIESVRMVNSGTEATMSAIRLARGYTGRNKIIKFNGCYHGHSDCLLVKAGSGALTHGNPDSAGVPASFTEHTLIAEFNNIEQIEKLFERYGEDIACIIIEPYPGNCGLLIPHNGYLKFLRDICDRYKSVLIFDEVMTGFRVALGGAQEREGIIPDLTTLGKVIGGGLPVGAFGGKKEIMEYIAPLGPVYQAGTLSGNPLAMAAGLTALEILQETRPYELLDTMAKSIKENLEAVAKEEGIPLSIPQVGSMLSFCFSEQIPRSFPDVMNSNRDYFIQIFRYALDNGVFLPPSPFEACFLSTAHQGEPLNIIIEVLSDTIRALKN